MMKTIFLTGAFGNLGCYVLRELLAQQYAVRAFDLDNKMNREHAATFDHAVNLEITWGDIRDKACLEDLVCGVDAVIHLACILPPVTEDAPELTQAVNVQASKSLMALCEVQDTPPQFLYASSFTVFGVDETQVKPRTINDAVAGTDNYTSQKLECEQALAKSKLNFMVGRIAVSIDEALRLADKRLVQAMFKVKADNKMEYVHPADIARAFVNGIDNAQAVRKTFLLGGGASCQITQLDLTQALLGAAGMKFTAKDLGSESYYTNWLDTVESEAVLNFQQYSFAQYKADVFQKLKWLRVLTWPISGLVKLAFLVWLKI